MPWTAGGNDRKMMGNDHLQQFALPHFFFLLRPFKDILQINHLISGRANPPGSELTTRALLFPRTVRLSKSHALAGPVLLDELDAGQLERGLNFPYSLPSSP
jgi:hypothetical protein